MLRAELIERGYDAIGFVEIQDALLGIYVRPAGKASIVILDLTDLDVTRTQLFTLAALKIPTIILGGAVELNNPILNEFTWAAIFRRPFLIGDVVAAIANFVRLPQP